MVVDCGGGTIDITVHELVSADRPVTELHKVCGAPFGSTGLSLLPNLKQNRCINCVVCALLNDLYA